MARSGLYTDATAGRTRRALLWSMVAGAVTPILVLVCGFAAFVAHLPTSEVVIDGSADGIVALTGGTSRISDAVELLAAGRGRRLLISGVGPATTADQMVRLNPEFERWWRCCIDFDQSLNTLGNAIETRAWAERLGFRSLIVVTSGYHMPRALAEISHQLPGVSISPCPVISDRLKTAPWWTDGTIAKLVVSEYLKYVVMHVRIGLNFLLGADASKSRQ
jgi:uncharacterized SAM-binding protein YcdF (DUF218 family)